MTPLTLRGPDSNFPCLPMRRGACGRCEGPLSAGRRVWCSDTCANEARIDHDWNTARDEALILNADCREGPHCVKCRLPRYRSDPGPTCGPLEVNHIEPLLGRKRSWTCRNHRDNLEVVCHDCHVAITAAQRAARRTPVVHD